ncbi:hypothetical protein [Infirmifilum sp.]|uniref:hypothetical protein n=1 Tax=Infirmifilum sp. TaxID=2856575 RepID=UPI003D1395D4
MPSRNKKFEVCVNLDNIERFMHFLFFYKANITSIITAGLELTDLKSPSNINVLVNNFNGYVGSLAAQGAKSGSRSSTRRQAPVYLTVQDFTSCEIQLSSSELIEMKEYLKSSIHPHEFKTSETYKTIKAFAELSKAADRYFKVKIGGDSVLVFVEAGREIIGRRDLGEINKDFQRLAWARASKSSKGGLSFSEAFVLAVALLVTRLKNCRYASARLLVIKDNYYTSSQLPVTALCDKSPYAWFYVNLYRKAPSSELIEPTSTALLTYMQTRSPTLLYQILRNATQARRLTPPEMEEVVNLARHIAK